MLLNATRFNQNRAVCKTAFESLFYTPPQFARPCLLLAKDSSFGSTTATPSARSSTSRPFTLC